MKRIVFIMVLLMSRGLLYAQSSIPVISGLSKSIFACIKERNDLCIIEKMESMEHLRKRLAPILMPYLKKDYDIIGGDTSNLGASITLDSIPQRQYDSIFRSVKSVSNDIEAVLDTIYTRAKRLNIDWNQVVYSGDKFYINEETNSNNEDWSATGSIIFSGPNNIYGIDYNAILINNQWKTEALHSYISISSKDGELLGVMRETYDDYKNQTDKSKATADSVLSNFMEINAVKANGLPVKDVKTDKK